MNALGVPGSNAAGVPPTRSGFRNADANTAEHPDGLAQLGRQVHDRERGNADAVRVVSEVLARVLDPRLHAQRAVPGNLRSDLDVRQRVRDSDNVITAVVCELADLR